MCAVTVVEERVSPSITEVKLRLLDEEKEGLLGFASCILDASFFLNNIAIRRGMDARLYLSYPATKSQQDVAHHHWNPITRPASEAVEDAILGRVRQLGSL